ncbi:hypothetical protein [uncultured Litoreibacter sp.]|uniref:hypothetical protein n=1 Tax=uncultured Litoreibacter sp. TaxID=1392394 RepID=UPI00260A359D|nr:hypothetical protein [uncultured Litoreibacter sp.]
MNQIINMVLRIFLRQLIKLGMSKGMSLMSKKRGNTARAQEMTPEQQRIAAEQSKRAKQAMRMARRGGR